MIMTYSEVVILDSFISLAYSLAIFPIEHS